MTADLDAFRARVLSHNPFLDNRVNGPAADEADVPGVNRLAFERLTGLAREALDEKRGLGTLLWGAAGVGKSHLLARLGRWAARDDRAVFVYLHNLQAAPDHLPRSVLRSAVSTLTAGRDDHLEATPLFRLVRSGILAAVGDDLREHSWGPLEKLFLARLGGIDTVGRTTGEVLFRFFRSVVRTRQKKEDGTTAVQAVRWLSGQALGLAEARNAGLPTVAPGDQVALADNQDIKSALVTLGRLAALADRPFILAFDQVDNLDTDQATALGRFIQALLDASVNLLVITAGVQATLLHWLEVRVMQESAWHRLAQFEVQLHRLTPSDALQIVAERLRRIVEPFAAVGPIREACADDLLFPLGRAWKDRFVEGKTDVRPRDIINWARDGWRAEQEALRAEGGAWLDHWAVRQEMPAPVAERGPTEDEIQVAIDLRVADKLAAQHAACERDASGLPPDEDQFEGLLYALLVQCRDRGLYGVRAVERVKAARPGVRPPFNFTLTVDGTEGGPAVRTGVRVLTATSATSVAGSLRRLLEDARALDRLLLVTDARVGLPLGTKGREYLQDLEQGGPQRFERLELSLGEYAELNALQAVVGLARSGDLEIEPRPGIARPVTEAEVLTAHHRLNHYLNCRLLRELLAAAPAPFAAASINPDAATEG